MMIRCWNATVITGAVALLVGDAPSALAQCPTSYYVCGRQLYTEFCEGCPGFSVCVCLYQGADCPSAEIICNTFDVFDDEPLYVVDLMPSFCYLRKNCRSREGGPCGVFPWGSNPCVKDGPWVAEGQMWDAEVLPCECPRSSGG